MNSLLVYLFLVACSYGYGQDLFDEVTQQQTEVQQKLKEKYQLTFSELIDYPKTIGLAKRMDSLDYEILFIEQVAGGKDSTRFYIIERYFFKGDSSYFLYYEDGILLTDDYHIYVYK